MDTIKIIDSTYTSESIMELADDIVYSLNSIDSSVDTTDPILRKTSFEKGYFEVTIHWISEE